jgi:hypothetical protein
MRAWGIEKGRIVDARHVFHAHLVEIHFVTRWRSVAKGPVLKVMIRIG